MICSAPHVTIVLASYNGARFISAQLRSLAMQTHPNWHVLLTDDGSTDDTVILARRSLPSDSLTVTQGPKKGVAANFLMGLKKTGLTDYVAFCDQDDLWMPNKLSRAVVHLSVIDGPAFYSSARVVTDHTLKPLKTQVRRTTSFASLMFRNRAFGNTMVMNADALDLLRASWPDTCPPFHDWWAALVLTGAGATWINDPRPSIFYRQHSGNIFGARGGRIRKVLDGTWAKWIAQNTCALQTAEPYMTTHHRAQYLKVTAALTRAGLPIAPTSVKTDPQGNAEMGRHVGWLRKIADGSRPVP